jgi:2-polyprenyl-6-hydroxyphenyl methylase/3-demethylubiquinone-9 3-methyltransferase
MRRENIAAARAHADGAGLAIDYRHGELAELGLAGFDLVTSMEVIEHVADKPAFVAALAATLAEGGLMVLSTPNRTPASRVLMVEAAERLGMVPRGTHHWDDFVTPLELHDLLDAAGLRMGNPEGIAWSPTKGLHRSDGLALNYIVTVTRA